MSENIEEKAAVAVEATPAAEPAKAAAPAEKRKKGGRMVPSGIAYVLATFNNTKVTFTEGKSIILKISYSSFEMQILRATRLQNLLKKRIEK